ncbi:MAG: tripartite tricarboxylate transporter substrate-binding protein, partial [Planctomycetota bacterium]
MRTLRGFILFAAATALFVSCQKDESYPSRPITLLCPWSAGGGTDLVSRQLALYLEQELEVPVNVINATGGSGVTGHGRGARARPDGYTLLMMTIEINMLHWRGLTDLDWQSYTPLMLLNRDAAAVFVPAESPWKTLKDLEAEVRKNPGKLRASGTATGGIWHLALAGWLT